MRWLAVIVLLGATHATAAPRVVDGEVLDARGRWTADGSRIVTDATVRTATGDVVVSQLGGTAEGLTMRTFPSLGELLAPGMRVSLAVHADADLARVPYTVVDAVRVMAYPAGFVRTGPTKHGHALYWESGCILVAEDKDGTKELQGDTELAIIDASIATWNDSTDDGTCSYMKVVSTGVTAATTEVGRDGTNLIKFRDSSWCRPKINGDPARCYPESAAGLTTAVFVDDGGSRDGAIVDADIEINGKNFAISANHVSLAPMILGQPYCRAELQNTLTHELGHLHGLEHTCLADGDPPRKDGQGNPVPACGATSDPKIVDATMYNFQDCDETKKEVLSADDITAICTIYPVASDPGTCKVADLGGGCCEAGPGGPPLALTLVVGVWIFRRRAKSARIIG